MCVMSSRDDYLITLYKDALEEQICDVEYVSLEPSGGHAYLFKPNSTDIRAVADRIGSGSVAQRTGKSLLHAAARFPPLLRFIPQVKRTTLPVGEKRQPDQILLSSRMRLIERSSEVIHTLPRNSTHPVRAEIDARQDLPSSLPVPPLLESDRSVPYFTEPYLKGRPAGHPEDAPERYIQIYEKLLPLYEATLNPRKSADSFVSRRLSETAMANDTVLQKTRSWIEQEALPDVFRTCDVHGDLHSANVLVTTDGPTLLDWENRHQDLAFVDLLRPFLVQYYERGTTDFLEQMVSGTGAGYAYATSYAELIGPLVYDEQKWYPVLVPLACLCLLEDMNRNSPMWSTCYELLGRLLEKR